MASDVADGCTMFNFEGLEIVASVLAEDGGVLEEELVKAEVLIERIANEGREMDVFKS